MKNEVIILGYGSIRKPRQKSNYLKYLVSKYSYEGLSKSEIQNLVIIANDLFETTENNRGISNLILGEILSQVTRYILSNPVGPKGGKLYFPCDDVIRWWMMGPHEYFGQKFSQIGKILSKVILRYQALEKTRFPELPYIGVGYKDKGKRSLIDKGYVDANQWYYQNQRLKVHSTGVSVFFDNPKQLQENLRLFSRKS